MKHYRVVNEGEYHYIIECEIPVLQYSEQEMDIRGIDSSSEEAFERVVCCMDLVELSPISGWRISHLEGCTTIWDKNNDTIHLAIPYDEFKDLYLLLIEKYGPVLKDASLCRSGA